MWRGFRWIALAGVVASAALIGPGSAFAGCGGGAATSIYSEKTCSASGKAKSTGQHQHQTAPTSTTPSQTYIPPVQVPKKTKKALKHAGKAKASLSRIVDNNAGPKLPPPLKLVPAAAATGLGSQFDLGSGPTFLVVLLLGTVLVLLGTGGVRAWRNRHRA